MTTFFAHHSDCIIERRKDELLGEVADLFDCDGDKLWQFPCDFTDAQIYAALDFANHTYKTGSEAGQRYKACQIKACLNID